ncbi:choice-of-anchor P family protein [Flavobacterium sp.]|uniref:choice-of-anchor P family protein n=1 Tax=Flavobacterium sp. TaxID=239 RepID=UPI002621DB2B|nr:choice-of-anchor P family protein [Flavobacterium sp.]
MKKINFKLGVLILFLTLGFSGCEKEEISTDNNSETSEKPGNPGNPNPGGSIAFSGQATALQAQVLGASIALSQTNPLPSTGGAEEASLLESNNVLGVLGVRVLHAATVGQGDKASSEASVAGININVGLTSISTGILMSRSSALCSSVNTPILGGSSEVVGLVINGIPIVVSGSPNQTITLPLGVGQVIINEQSQSVLGNYGEITVTALHVKLIGVADIIVSRSHSDIQCLGSPACGSGDFITGGGWLTAPSGAKGNFAVAGGIKNGNFWGHLNYIDHGAGGPKIKGNSITSYNVLSPTRREIKGTCEINGSGNYLYTVVVTDNGEPGTNDTFSLVTNGYNVSGVLRGGNIQLHKQKACKK